MDFQTCEVAPSSLGSGHVTEGHLRHLHGGGVLEAGEVPYNLYQRYLIRGAPRPVAYKRDTGGGFELISNTNHL